MIRYLSAIIFLVAAAYIAWYNSTHGDSTLLLPGLDVIVPSLKGADAQGRATAYLFMGVGIFLFLNAVRRHIRDARAEGEL